MNEVRTLLEQFWIARETDKETYFRVKRDLPQFRKFIQEQLGWRLIQNEKLLKLEKIPARAESFMGITEFQEVRDYCILCVVLIFLEDKEEQEQFLLSELVDFISLHLKRSMEVDWNSFSQRKSLVRALQYKEKQIRCFFRRCRISFQEKAEKKPAYHLSADWIAAAYEEKTYGYQIVLREWNRNPQEAEKVVMTAGMALREVLQGNALQDDAAQSESIPGGGGVMLAVLASKVSGNPHFFDRGTAAGQILTCSLCWHSGASYPAGAEELAALYLKYGIHMDEISSMVAVFGLHLERNGRLLPGTEGFLQEKEPFVLMQKNLDGVTRAYGEGSCVFVVENEMVFSHLCRECSGLPKGRSTVILCTMGQPRKAAWQLLDLLAAENLEIFYSGDLDPEGMDIAERIWKRHPEQVRLWRMGPEDYEKSLSEEIVDERRLSMLRRLQNPQLLATAKSLLKKKKAGYQETLLDEMVSDIRALL